MGSTVFRNPQTLSSPLAALGSLQPRALRFLNAVDPLVSVSNLYLECKITCNSALGIRIPDLRELVLRLEYGQLALAVENESQHNSLTKCS